MTFKTRALHYYNLGYTPIPVQPKTKRPAIKGWQNVQHDILQIQKLIDEFPNNSIGVLTKDVPWIDVDTTSSIEANNVLMYIMSLIPDTELTIRTGKAPKYAIPFQTTELLYKQKCMLSENNIIEILADGQFILVEGIHPITKQPYILNHPLPNVKKLPLLTQHIIDNLFSVFSTSNVKKEKANKTQSRRIDISDENMIKILDDIPNVQNYDNWLSIGMALYYQYKGDKKGELLWHYFSQKIPATYDPKEIENKYYTFDDKRQGYTLATLKYMTKTYTQRRQNTKFIIT